MQQPCLSITKLSFMMPLIEPNGRPFVQCQRCRTAVVLPSEEHSGELHAFAVLARLDSVAAMRHAENVFSLGPREAKALVLHVSLESGLCNRCHKPVDHGITACSCRSANLNW